MCKAGEFQECSEAVGEVVCCMMRVWDWITPSWPVCSSQLRPYGEAQAVLSNHCFLHTPKYAVRLSIKELWTSHPLKWLTNVFDYVAKQIFRCWQSLVNQETRALSTEIHHVQGKLSTPHYKKKLLSSLSLWHGQNISSYGINTWWDERHSFTMISPHASKMAIPNWHKSKFYATLGHVVPPLLLVMISISHQII